MTDSLCTPRHDTRHQGMLIHTEKLHWRARGRRRASNTTQHPGRGRPPSLTHPSTRQKTILSLYDPKSPRPWSLMAGIFSLSAAGNSVSRHNYSMRLRPGAVRSSGSEERSWCRRSRGWCKVFSSLPHSIISRKLMAPVFLATHHQLSPPRSTDASQELHLLLYSSTLPRNHFYYCILPKGAQTTNIKACLGFINSTDVINK